MFLSRREPQFEVDRMRLGVIGEIYADGHLCLRVGSDEPYQVVVILSFYLENRDVDQAYLLVEESVVWVLLYYPCITTRSRDVFGLDGLQALCVVCQNEKILVLACN